MTWYNRPFPYLRDAKHQFLLAILVGVVVSVTLIVFRPFGLQIVQRPLFFVGFGAISFCSLIMHLWLGEKLLPAIFNAESWTLRRQILLLLSIVTLIGVSNYIYNSKVGIDISPQYDLFTMIMMTFAVGVLPVVIMMYVYEVVARQQNEADATILNRQHVESDQIIEELVFITPESVKEAKLEIRLRDFIYAKSANNYSEVNYMHQGTLVNKLIRLKLKSLEEQVSSHDDLLRCHRSYIINRSQILQYEGNARSLVLQLRHVNQDIPVSRKFDKQRFEVE